MMTLDQFAIANDKLKAYRKQQEKLDEVLKVISPSGTGVVEFGNEFIQDYIKIVSIAINDPECWYEWFVYDNNYGRNRLTAQINKKDFIIKDCKSFYEFMVEINATH
jgi:hypothetical protein